MTTDRVHPLAEDYLRRLRRAGRHLPPERLQELLSDIRVHLAESLAPDASDAQAREILHRLGTPEDIVDAELPATGGPADRRGWREWGAVILLPLGGILFGVGWILGLTLLWSSRLWTTREKLLGTLIVPGGIATTLVVLIVTGTKQLCRTYTSSGPPGGPLPIPATSHCTIASRPGALLSTLQIPLIVVCVIGPILVAVYLARRARYRSAF